jgi:threonine dehydrogenase-like Zn-dependent dehydrogenase
VKALTVEPGVAGSARLEDVAVPAAAPGQLVLRPRLVGLCGTDTEIVEGGYGTAPPGRDRLIIGHEAVAEVEHAPEGSAHRPGELVVPIVRRPDPVPCGSCAVGEWDMCRNGRYTEHGIKGLDGFAREVVVADPVAVVAVPRGLGHLAVLVEPASIVAKAWEQIERIGQRASWMPRTVLVTGAGPVGLLAALGARHRGFETHVLDRVDTGPKPALVEDLGATYHTGPVAGAGPVPDIIVECTGAWSVVLDAFERTSMTGIVCLAGLSSGARSIPIDAAALNRQLVLENDVVFGTVNANARHYRAAVAALDAADPDWLGRLITRREPIDRWDVALARRIDDVKVVIEI